LPTEDDGWIGTLRGLNPHERPNIARQRSATLVEFLDAEELYWIPPILHLSRNATAQNAVRGL